MNGSSSHAGADGWDDEPGWIYEITWEWEPLPGQRYPGDQGRRRAVHTPVYQTSGGDAFGGEDHGVGRARVGPPPTHPPSWTGTPESGYGENMQHPHPGGPAQAARPAREEPAWNRPVPLPERLPEARPPGAAGPGEPATGPHYDPRTPFRDARPNLQAALANYYGPRMSRQSGPPADGRPARPDDRPGPQAAPPQRDALPQRDGRWPDGGPPQRDGRWPDGGPPQRDGRPGSSGAPPQRADRAGAQRDTGSAVPYRDSLPGHQPAPPYRDTGVMPPGWDGRSDFPAAPPPRGGGGSSPYREDRHGPPRDAPPSSTPPYGDARAEESPAAYRDARSVPQGPPPGYRAARPATPYRDAAQGYGPGVYRDARPGAPDRSPHGQRPDDALHRDAPPAAWDRPYPGRQGPTHPQGPTRQGPAAPLRDPRPRPQDPAPPAAYQRPRMVPPEREHPRQPAEQTDAYPIVPGASPARRPDVPPPVLDAQPQSPVPQSPVPQSPVPQSPVPQSPVPQYDGRRRAPSDTTPPYRPLPQIRPGTRSADSPRPASGHPAPAQPPVVAAGSPGPSPAPQQPAVAPPSPQPPIVASRPTAPSVVSQSPAPPVVSQPSPATPTSGRPGRYPATPPYEPQPRHKLPAPGPAERTDDLRLEQRRDLSAGPVTTPPYTSRTTPPVERRAELLLPEPQQAGPGYGYDAEPVAASHDESSVEPVTGPPATDSGYAAIEPVTAPPAHSGPDLPQASASIFVPLEPLHSDRSDIPPVAPPATRPTSAAPGRTAPAAPVSATPFPATPVSATPLSTAPNPATSDSTPPVSAAPTSPSGWFAAPVPERPAAEPDVERSASGQYRPDEGYPPPGIESARDVPREVSGGDESAPSAAVADANLPEGAEAPRGDDLTDAEQALGLGWLLSMSGLGAAAAEPEPAAESLPVSAEPASAQPASTTPASAQPASATPVDAQRIDAQPVNAQRVDAQPVDDGLVETPTQVASETAAQADAPAAEEPAQPDGDGPVRPLSSAARGVDWFAPATDPSMLIPERAAPTPTPVPAEADPADPEPVGVADEAAADKPWIETTTAQPGTGDTTRVEAADDRGHAARPEPAEPELVVTTADEPPDLPGAQPGRTASEAAAGTTEIGPSTAEAAGDTSENIAAAAADPDEDRTPEDHRTSQNQRAPEDQTAEDRTAEDDQEAVEDPADDEDWTDEEPERRLLDPEQVLAAYRWRFDPETLREQVDDPGELRAVRNRLTDKLEYAERHAVRARLLSLRAVVSRLLGDHGRALADARKAIRHAEATGELRRISIAQARLAHVLQWQGDFAAADRMFEEANSAELPERLRAAICELAGRCAYEQGRYLEAVNLFERALDVHRVADPDLIGRVERALDAIEARVRIQGWGPYPRTREEILQQPAAPHPTLGFDTRLWGYADRDGELVVPERYAGARPFHDGVAWALRPQARAWELIDTGGRVLVDESAGYVAVGPFAEGLAWVSRDATGGWFAIDQQNRVIIAAGFDDVRAFHRGLAPVRRSGWGAVDRHGRLVVQPKYRGFATALTNGRHLDGFTDEGLAVVDAGDRKGVVDRTGQLVVAPVHAALLIHPVAFVIGDRNGRWGALDRQGEPLIDVVHATVAQVAVEIDGLLTDTRPVL